MNKRGQFFLIATIVIAGLIVGLSLIQISTKAPKEETAIYDLSREIGFESNKVIDYGVFNSVSQAQLSNNLTSLLDYYAAISPETEVMVIYGNENSLQGVYYTEKADSTGLSTGTGSSMKVLDISSTSQNITKYISVYGERIKVDINENISYEFDLKSGENFYIVLEKKKGEEKIVATN